MSNVNVREINPKLKNGFKAWCAKKGITMQDALTALMEMAIENNLQIKLIIAKNKKEKENGNSKDSESV